MGLISSIVFSLFSLIPLVYLLVRKHNRKLIITKRSNNRLPLPPGSTGWPFIGETLQLYCQDPTFFFSSRQKRHGEIFKSHLLGCPCVMLASPEAARFVLVTQAHLFKPTYPKSKEKMIGKWAVMFHQGDYHTHVRRLIQSCFSPEALRRHVGSIDDMVVSTLEKWDGEVIRTFDAMKMFAFEVGVMAVFGRLEGRYKEELRKMYFIVDKGYNCFPTNIPWTSYQKAIQAKRRVNEILMEIIVERKEKKEVMDKDLLSCLVNYSGNGRNGDLRLTDEQIADNVNGVLFAAQDTSASVMTWIVKYLHDNPQLLDAVKAEHMEIYESNSYGEKRLTLNHIKNNMPLTHRVILESLRMASVISFTFREAAVDVEYKGYLIPKGWKVMPLFRNIHHDPQFFQDPHIFDPSRFKTAPKPNTFLPFGNGVHACPGNELAKLEMLIMIHHLVTQYRWKIMGSDEVEYGPFPVPKEGLPAEYWRVSSSSSSSSMT